MFLTYSMRGRNGFKRMVIIYCDSRWTYISFDIYDNTEVEI